MQSMSVKIIAKARAVKRLACLYGFKTYQSAHIEMNRIGKSPNKPHLFFIF